MHIKTGSWEASSSVCESDSLCDPAAVLVSAANSEPHIRNRRLSPGSGNCGGGGGGCISSGSGVVVVGGDQQQPRQPSPDGDHAPHGFTYRKERKGPQHKGRSLRREAQKGAGRPVKNQKERWVEDSLSLLRPPPAFPVQDSPAKLQPAVSYASKVKAGPAGGGLDEDRPAIGVLLQNQWGLSFISDNANANANALLPTHQTPEPQQILTVQSPEDTPLPAVSPAPVTPAPIAANAPVATTRPEDDESNGKLLLSCRHLVEALNYHSREWNATCNKQKKAPNRVVWYKDTKEHPA